MFSNVFISVAVGTCLLIGVAPQRLWQRAVRGLLEVAKASASHEALAKSSLLTRSSVPAFILRGCRNNTLGRRFLLQITADNGGSAFTQFRNLHSLR